MKYYLVILQEHESKTTRTINVVASNINNAVDAAYEQMAIILVHEHILSYYLEVTQVILLN
jgi:hypothetical protein